MIADVAPPLICQYTLSELAPARRVPGGCWGFTGPIPLPLWINVARYSLLPLIMGRGPGECQTRDGGWVQASVVRVAKRRANRGHIAAGSLAFVAVDVALASQEHLHSPGVSRP